MLLWTQSTPEVMNYSESAAHLCSETNPVEIGYHLIPREKRVDWTEPGLTITRLRLVSDPGYPVWDVSYCHGRLADGTEVKVSLPFIQLPKRGMRRALYAEAQRTGKFIPGLFDSISTLQ